MNKVDYILTGASGFLGSYLHRFLSAHFTVRTIGRSFNNDIVVDLSASEPLIDQNLQVDTVVHAAGKAHLIPKNDHDKNDFFLTNVQGTINLAKGLERLTVLPKNLIYISTVSVYGREQGERITEDFELKGVSPYAQSKIDAEKFLIHWCSSHQISLTILRLPLVVGVNAPGNLAAVDKWMKRGLYIGIGKGVARKSMVWAQDVAEYIPLVAGVSGIFNLTDGDHPAIVDFENAYARYHLVSKPLRLPEYAFRFVAQLGDLLGAWFPLNTSRYQKLTATLTFSDECARASAHWKSKSVIWHLSQS